MIRIVIVGLFAREPGLLKTGNSSGMNATWECWF